MSGGVHIHTNSTYAMRCHESCLMSDEACEPSDLNMSGFATNA